MGTGGARTTLAQGKVDLGGMAPHRLHIPPRRKDSLPRHPQPACTLLLRLHTPPTAALRELHFTPRHLAVSHQPTNGEKLAGKARLWGVRAQRRRGADSTAEGAGEPRSAGPPDARAQGPPPCRVARRQVVSQGRQPRPSKKQTLPDFRGSAVSSLL